MEIFERVHNLSEVIFLVILKDDFKSAILNLLDFKIIRS